MVSSHRSHTDIPEKANRVLNVILVAFILIIIRVWHLAVIQHDQKVEEAKKPQRRTVIEPAIRATIRDRFNIPLAINKIQYNAAVLYSQFRQIPTVVWTRDSQGKRTKRFKRKEYIAALSQFLGHELKLDPERLEDLIHSKAAFYYHLPFVIKEDLSEQEYYRLKMLEKDWLGIHVQHSPKRTYPKGKVGADIIGYMGAINRQEYETILYEMNALEEFLTDFEAGNDPALPPGISSPSYARNRLKELQEHAYTINDYVGKSGIESRFEENMRGFRGKKSYYSDARGNFLRELPGSSQPVPGERILLSISSELQEFAEQLLIQNEPIRQAYISKGENGQPVLFPRQPWIKGGAIIAMDPKSGEVLAMASYPRFDPNDFIAGGTTELNSQKQSNIRRWFETDSYLAEIWDQKRPLERERFNVSSGEFEEEKVFLDWDTYLHGILPPKHPVIEELKHVGNLENAIAIQQAMEILLSFSGQTNPYWMLDVIYTGENHNSYGPKTPQEVKLAIDENINWDPAEFSKQKAILDRFFVSLPNHYDKVLLVDLCRLLVNGDSFPNALIPYAGKQNINSYRNVSAAMAVVVPVVRLISQNLFHEIDFKAWRAKHGKEFLKQKRLEEKQEKKYAKPYIDYLDAQENQLFAQFWEDNRWKLFEAFFMGIAKDAKPLEEYTTNLSHWHKEITNGAHQEENWISAYKILQTTLNTLPRHVIIPYLQTLRSFKELNRPLLGQYSHLRKSKGPQRESQLAMAFYPVHGFGYGRSFAFRQSTTQGSLFKLVTAYTALTQKYRQIESSAALTKKNLNPLEITDNTEKIGNETIVGYHSDGQPIPLIYKEGRLPRSLSKKIGKINIIQAIETSSNPYFALLAGDFLENPDLLAHAARNFSYGKRTGIDLPAEIAGKIPDDLQTNKTGLYATAIGQHSLVVTPLQSSIMLSAIASSGTVLKPQIVRMSVGLEKEISRSEQIEKLPHFPYQSSLSLVGIDFPLFTSALTSSKKNEIKQFSPVAFRKLFMPNIVRDMLIDGMHSSYSRIHRASLTSLSNLYHDHPEAISDLIDLQNQLVGKTSTSEVDENLSMDSTKGTETFVHIWFGGISFDQESDKTSFTLKDKYGNPELVVVVYLRFGKYGRDAAPLAAQIVNKWREIKEKNPD
jgi:cell division protein FtsI/penicillin-binding protein 2